MHSSTKSFQAKYICIHPALLYVGSGGRDRTSNFCINSAAFYQLNYPGIYENTRRVGGSDFSTARSARQGRLGIQLIIIGEGMLHANTLPLSRAGVNYPAYRLSVTSVFVHWSNADGYFLSC